MRGWEVGTSKALVLAVLVMAGGAGFPAGGGEGRPVLDNPSPWGTPGIAGWLSALGGGHPGRKLSAPSSGAQVQKPPGRTARAAYRTCALSTCSFLGLFNAAQGIRTPFASPVGEQQGGWGKPAPPLKVLSAGARGGSSRDRALRPAVACGSRRSSEPGAEWPYTR